MFTAGPHHHQRVPFRPCRSPGALHLGQRLLLFLLRPGLVVSEAAASCLLGFFRDELRLLTGRKPCFDHAMRMPTKPRRSGHDRARRSRPSNTHPLVATFPAPQPWDAADPLPVMRREMKLLLIETSMLRDQVERLRAAEQEARYLSASVDQIMESRDQWRREAERLRALIAQVTPWSLLWWRCLDTLRAWRGVAPRPSKPNLTPCPLEARWSWHHSPS